MSGEGSASLSWQAERIGQILTSVVWVFYRSIFDPQCMVDYWMFIVMFINVVY
jgi:hypothetical protein